MKFSLKAAPVAALVLCAMAVLPARAASTPAHPTSSIFSVQIAGVDMSTATRVDFLTPSEPGHGHHGDGFVALRLTRRLINVTGSSTELLAWRQQQKASSQPDRRDVTLVLFDASGAEGGRIQLGACTPVAWRGPQLSSTGDAPAITESLDIECNSVRFSGPF